MKNFAKIILIFGLLFQLKTIFSEINYSEYFPNNRIFQSLENGWTTPQNSEKEIMTPDGCKKIKSTIFNKFFIPTRTGTEWGSFKNFYPSGISIADCNSDAVCGSAANLSNLTSEPKDNLCSVGTPKDMKGFASSFNWTCKSDKGKNAECKSSRKLTCEDITNVPLLRFGGNIDHTLIIYVKVVTESGEPFIWWEGKPRGQGLRSGGLKQKVAEVGGYYEETYETKHGDLEGWIKYTPIKKSELDRFNIKELEEICDEWDDDCYIPNNFIFRKISGNVPQFWVKQSPTKENDWVAGVQFFTPAPGEQYIDGELYLANLDCTEKNP